MSFSSDVKVELCKVGEEESCCQEAELYAMLLCAQSFSLDSMRLQTESYAAARRLAIRCFEVAGMDASISVRNSPLVGDTYVVTVDKPEDCRAIFTHMNGGDEPFLRINTRLLQKPCCVDAFLRGAFLSCGTMTDPQKEYHFEFVLPYFRLASDMMDVLELAGFQPKSVVRKSNQIVYFKESESIEDLLVHMGAQQAAFELMNVKIYKGLKNETNRRANCETANLNKTVSAATRQVEAIRRLQKTGAFSQMPDELQEVARVRMKYPYASLSELMQKLPQALTKSGLNHRLRRIVEFEEN